METDANIARYLHAAGKSFACQLFEFLNSVVCRCPENALYFRNNGAAILVNEFQETPPFICLFFYIGYLGGNPKRLPIEPVVQRPVYFTDKFRKPDLLHWFFSVFYFLTAPVSNGGKDVLRSHVAAISFGLDLGLTPRHNIAAPLIT